MDELFCQFDRQLAQQGNIARGGQIIDASIVPVPRNHNPRQENRFIKNGKIPEDWANTPAKRSQKDVDARRTKKYDSSKNHVNVDRKRKLMLRYQVNDVAMHYI